MTVIPVVNSLIDESESAVKLSRYAQILGISENQFFGLNNPATLTESCHPIWTLFERQTIARYLREAQDEIEQIVGYPLFPRWIVDEFQYYKYPVHARWGKVIAGGFKNIASIHAGQSLTFTTDPVSFFHATTITDVDQIAVFHPGTTVEIIPSSITISGGNVLIEIPWARLIKLSMQDNDDNGLPYAIVPPAADTPYEATVDIGQIYNDDSIQGGLYWHHRTASTCDCGCAQCCATCGDYTENACIYVRNPETGALDLISASYDRSVPGMVAVCPVCYCANPDSVRLNYRAGLTTLTAQIEDAIIRLAHSKMPQAPCGCGLAQEYWTRDRDIPTLLTPEQVACPFGQSRGAWFAWKQAAILKNQIGMAF